MATLYNQVPSVSAVFSLYTSFSAITMLFRTILNEVVPERIREYVALRVVDFFSSYFQSNFTFVIEERWEFAENQTFRAAEVYLPTRLAGLSTGELLVGSSDLKNPEAWSDLNRSPSNMCLGPDEYIDVLWPIIFHKEHVALLAWGPTKI
uniref:AAA-type ATPase N-terminal domain-containing protein n=2 Tax=Brassica oleracea TaxID=3712 RepID=A0A0D3C156_BRAOL|nr:unnamed protein product [Brassica oleracea]